MALADDGSGPMVTATIYRTDGSTTTTSVSSAALLADPQRCPPYTNTTMASYGPSGNSPTGLPHENGSGSGTWTLPTILGCLQNPVSVAAVQSVTVLDGDGTPQVSESSQLHPADLAPPTSDFQDPSEYPVVSNLGSSFQYNRPWRGGSDLNASDQVTSAAPIAIEVFEGMPLTVTATASPSTAAPRTHVSFNAQVSGQQGSSLTYNWSFGGDNVPDSTSASPTVTYGDAGTYTVTLLVTDASGGGGSATVRVTVTGSPATTPTTSAGPPTPPAPVGGGGTNPKGGHKGRLGNGHGSARHGHGNGNPSRGSTHRASSPTSKRPPTTPGSSRRSHPSGGSTRPRASSTAGATPGTPAPTPGTSKSAAPTPSTSNPAAPTPSTSNPAAPTPSTSTPAAPMPTASPVSPQSLPPRSSHRTHRAPTNRRTSSRAGAPRSEFVSGRLIADITPLPAGASPLVQRQPGSAAQAPAPRRPAGRSPLAVILACLAIVLLLGSGARRELRGPGGRRLLGLGS